MSKTREELTDLYLDGLNYLTYMRNPEAEQELQKIFTEIFVEAISNIGLDNFKKTSMFGSNHPASKVVVAPGVGL